MSDRPTLSDLGITPQIARALDMAGYIIVPIIPTPEMVGEAYWSAYEGEAANVWGDMIQVWSKSKSGNSGTDKA